MLRFRKPFQVIGRPVFAHHTRMPLCVSWRIKMSSAASSTATNPPCVFQYRWMGVWKLGEEFRTGQLSIGPDLSRKAFLTLVEAQGYIKRLIPRECTAD